MFKVTPNGINRFDIEMSGKLNAEDIKIALDELVSKSKNIENGRMLYEATTGLTSDTDKQLLVNSEEFLNFGHCACLYMNGTKSLAMSNAMIYWPPGHWARSRRPRCPN